MQLQTVRNLYSQLVRSIKFVQHLAENYCRKINAKFDLVKSQLVLNLGCYILQFLNT